VPVCLTSPVLKVTMIVDRAKIITADMCRRTLSKLKDEAKTTQRQPTMLVKPVCGNIGIL